MYVVVVSMLTYRHYCHQLSISSIKLGCPKNCLVVQSSQLSGHAHLACEVFLTAGGQGPLKAPRSSGVNGAKSCILGISWHINLSFTTKQFFGQPNFLVQMTTEYFWEFLTLRDYLHSEVNYLYVNI
jgi:hypothetical protein